jgi:hypothetical protein
MKPAKNLAELRKCLLDVSTCVAGDTKFTAMAILFLAEQQDEQLRLIYRQMIVVHELAQAASALGRAVERQSARLAQRRTGDGQRRQPTAWNRFFGEGIKAGKTPTEIATEWRTPENGP